MFANCSVMQQPSQTSANTAKQQKKVLVNLAVVLLLAYTLPLTSAGPNEPVYVSSSDYLYSQTSPAYRAHVLCNGGIPYSATSYTPININVGAKPCPNGFENLRSMSSNSLKMPAFRWRAKRDCGTFDISDAALRAATNFSTCETDMMIFPPQPEDYCSNPETSALCSQYSGTTGLTYTGGKLKKRNFASIDNDDDFSDAKLVSNLQRRAIDWSLYDRFTFMQSVPRDLCFVTYTDLLPENLPVALDSNNNSIAMNPNQWPCGNIAALSKCAINGTVFVGQKDPKLDKTTYNIAYACYKKDKNIRYEATSCQIIKKNHGVNDLAGDTFLDGFKDYMVSNPYIWRHCWTYNGQTATHAPAYQFGGSLNFDKVVDKSKQVGIFEIGKTNKGAGIIDYRSGSNYFKNIGCLVDNAGIDQKDNSRRLLTGYLRGFFSGYTSSVSVCLRVGIMYGFTHCGVQTFTTGSQCWCGTNLNGMLPQIPDSRCVKKCSGIPNEICGGNWVSNVYQIRAYDGIAGDCSKAPNVLSNSDIDFDRILFLLNKSSPFNSTLSGNWRGWTLRKANSLNGISNPSSSLMNALNITSNIGFLTIARFGSLDSWGIMLKGTYPIYMALNVNVFKGFWYQFSMTLTCKMAVNDPTILGYLRITHGSNVVLYNLQHHDNQNYSYVKPFEYSILGTKFKANGTMAKIEIWNNKNSFDVFLDDLRLVKLTTKVIRTADWENLEDSECPVSKTLDYADGDLFQCGDFSLDTLHEESTYLNDYSREYSGLLTNWGVKSRYYFNKTQYAMFLDGNAAGGFLRKYPDSQNFNEYDPFDNLRVFEQNKVLDCNVLWGPSAFGRDMTACNLTQSNLILNRRFESNTCSGTGFLCNLNSLQNWSSSDTKFRVYRTNYNGTWSLYLDPQTPRVISQIVNNVKLGYYKLSFWFKGSPGLFMMKSFLSSSGTLPDKDIYYNPFGFGKTDWDWTRHEYDDILRSDPGYENDSFLITFKPNTNNVIGVSYVDEINLVRVKCNGYE